MVLDRFPVLCSQTAVQSRPSRTARCRTGPPADESSSRQPNSTSMQHNEGGERE